MHYLNEYYKSHIHETVTFKEKCLNFLKHSLCAPQLCAEFLERIVRTIGGFTVYICDDIYICIIKTINDL